jgi:hypothetical protein
MKKHFLFLWSFIILLVTGQVTAQNNNERIADNLFKNRSEIYFKVKVLDRSDVDLLSRVISIDDYKGNVILAYANRDEFARFLDYHYSYEVLPNPSSLICEKDLNMGKLEKTKSNLTVWNAYPTYTQYLSYMTGFAAAHPDICRLDTIGTTVHGRLLLMLKISDSVNVDRGVPQVLYTSSIHGDEVGPYVFMLHLIDSLLSGYGQNSRITNLVNNHQIFINPLANPDGTYAGGNNTVYNATRYNGNGVDLNRNYPDPGAGPHPDGQAWQPETVAFMNFADSTHLVMSLNFHAGSEVFNYPWDTWQRSHADASWWNFVGREYADTVHHYGPTGYFNDEDNGVTDGWAWYMITGGRQDYHMYFKHDREATLEISTIKILPTNQLINYWNYNVHSFLNYIEESSYGINGQITDSVTGVPVRAQILIPSHDMDSSFVYSSLPSGWYFRTIDQGTYNLTVTASGYFPKNIPGVNVSRRTTNRLNIKLIPVNIGGIRNNIVQNYPLVFPNPTDGITQLKFPEYSGISSELEVINSSGIVVLTQLFENHHSTSIMLDVHSFAKGIYFLRLHEGDTIYQCKMVII